MPDKILLRGGNAADLPTLDSREPGIALDTQDFYLGTPNGNISFPRRTLANRTLYVSTTGSDASGVGSIDSPYATWNYALSKLPKNINHDVSIIGAAGTYAENVSIVGFKGSGKIVITGAVTATTTHSTQNIEILDCDIRIEINGINLTTITGVAAVAKRCTEVQMTFLNIVGSAVSFDGIQVECAALNIQNSVISNRGSALVGLLLADIFTQNNTGTGNGNVLVASSSAIRKNGTQPSGTTAELELAGGKIT